jgi:NTP pyrophosphatase (non-canonical NTP hydrolase)
LTDHFNKLTNPEVERLACLAEECGEVIQVIGKIIRHGYEHSHVKYGDRTNRENLSMEIGDLLIAIQMLIDNKDLDEATISWSRTAKLAKINGALRYNQT